MSGTGLNDSDFGRKCADRFDTLRAAGFVESERGRESITFQSAKVAIRVFLDWQAHKVDADMWLRSRASRPVPFEGMVLLLGIHGSGDRSAHNAVAMDQALEGMAQVYEGPARALVHGDQIIWEELLWRQNELARRLTELSSVRMHSAKEVELSRAAVIDKFVHDMKTRMNQLDS